MILARVDGHAVTATAHPSLKGLRLLICQPINELGVETGEPVVAFDQLGAGLHAKVYFTTDGSAAQEATHDSHSPLRNMIAGLVDAAGGAKA